MSVGVKFLLGCAIVENWTSALNTEYHDSHDISERNTLFVFHNSGEHQIIAALLSLGQLQSLMTSER